MTHPGIRMATDFSAKTYFKEKEKTNRLLSRNHQLTYGGELGWYHHQQNLDGFLLGATFGYRYQKNIIPKSKPHRTFQAELNIGAGWYRYNLAGTTYIVDDNGINSQNLGGSSAFMPSAGISIAHNIPNKKNIPISIYTRASFYLQTGHNTGVDYKPFLEGGISYQF